MTDRIMNPTATFHPRHTNEPPIQIKARKTRQEYTRRGLLGEGGFAKCYAVVDLKGNLCAAKVVSKESLSKSPKNKPKLLSEIKIHKLMEHPNIVRFHEAFEDDAFVYLILEYCPNKTLLEMNKFRKRLTEPEVRYFLCQILDACRYMHRTCVIHRDLKLANLLLSEDMKVKIGDFGLATQLQDASERKKTICGTPNYIAPEVLFDKTGHSYEVDIWSVGVIVYTLLFGKPPFQTKGSVEDIYRKIKEHKYDFPSNINVSSEAKDLINYMLTQQPEDRPTIDQVLNHPFFKGFTPTQLPTSALRIKPDFEPLLPSLKLDGLNNPNPPFSINNPKFGMLENRRPLVVLQENRNKQIPKISSTTGGGENRRPLTVLQDNRNKQMTASSNTIGPKDSLQPLKFTSTVNLPIKPSITNARAINVTSTKTTATTTNLTSYNKNHIIEPKDIFPPVNKTTHTNRQSSTNESHDNKITKQVSTTDPIKPTVRFNLPPSSSSSSSKTKTTTSGNESPSKAHQYSAIGATYDTLEKVFAESKLDKPQVSTKSSPSEAPVPPTVFITKWMDYSTKFGIGYELTDGTVGMHLNDKSTLVLSPDELHFEFISSRLKRSLYTLEDYPDALAKKVGLLKNFKSALAKPMFKTYPYSYVDKNRTEGMIFLTKYTKTAHGILFRLSNRVVQVNFYDHHKFLLSDEGRVVTWINSDQEMKTLHVNYEIFGDQYPVIASRLKYIREILKRMLIEGEIARTPFIIQFKDYKNTIYLQDSVI
ncbi:1571_t:CDS:10 [Ambispora leptoticha]|uniref:Serine/threonine-protein kinase n=1 Tax=Ambispora leptoticha TaxID=144679 RepID=A0A9N8WLN3_9GLOM|nr:1571_t:CDS:10 [Ambispora leptoticha]